MDLHPEPREGYEWRVIWFPPDRSHGIFHGTEEQVRQRAQAESEWNPLIERRHYRIDFWEECE